MRFPTVRAIGDYLDTSGPLRRPVVFERALMPVCPVSGGAERAPRAPGEGAHGLSVALDATASAPRRGILLFLQSVTPSEDPDAILMRRFLTPSSDDKGHRRGADLSPWHLPS